MTPQEAIKILKPLFEHCKGKNECLGYIEHFFTKDEEEALDMAIKALEQPPCKDCISREQAVYVASGYCAPQNIADELRKLPSVTPQQTRWIPVTERLPEEGQSILFSTKTDEVFEGTYFNVGEGNRNWYAYRDENYAWNNVVIAWMPLPPSYQGE